MKHEARIRAALARGTASAGALPAPLSLATASRLVSARCRIAAGKHVLVEKPVAVASADIDRLALAARGSGRVCMPRSRAARLWVARIRASRSLSPSAPITVIELR